MDLLEQQLDAVAFRAYSLPEVAAAWTCLAAALAAAAAAGLWRRWSSTAPSDAIAGDAKPLESETRPASLMMSSSPDTETETETERVLEPRERYTAYYNYDDSDCVGCCDIDEEEEEEDQDPEDEDGASGPPAPEETDPFQWAVVRSLPLTAPAAPETARFGISRPPLGGSVVRLWDQAAGTGRSLTASPRRRSGRSPAAAGTIDLGLLVTPKY